MELRCDFIKLRKIFIQICWGAWQKRTIAMSFLFWRDWTYFVIGGQYYIRQEIKQVLWDEIKILHRARVYRGDYDPDYTCNMIIERKWQKEINDMWARLIASGIRSELWYIIGILAYTIYTEFFLAYTK